VVPGGEYDLEVRRGSRTARHPRVEIPAERTRLWLAP
jgi:hypothetical protein